MPHDWTIWLLILPVTMAVALSVGSNKDYGMLVDQVHVLAKQIQASSANEMELALPVTVGSTTRPRVPGFGNVCVNLCPKWCQKSVGKQSTYTNCHYVCGNICHNRIREANPFIGNPVFEVVPSSYQFSDYDLNQDKLLSVEEISRTERVQPDEILHLFHFADFNHDGFIDHDEFQGGPFVFTVQMAAELTAVAKGRSAQLDSSESDDN